MPRVAKDSVYVMLAPGFEEGDVSTVTRSLRRSGVSVSVVGLAAGPVRGAYGLSLASDRALSEVEMECPRAIVLPGGVQASRQLSADPRVHHLLRRVVGGGGFVVALEGAYAVLRSAGLLQSSGCQQGNGLVGDQAADPTHATPDGVLPEDSGRVVVDGPAIIGRVPGTAQEAALTLVWLLEQRAPGFPRGW
jgi:4-methyl-5(b-hydroxyethyl)-thiazole monophosphate biosynthesis